jgi:hypothetical protein
MHDTLIAALFTLMVMSPCVSALRATRHLDEESGPLSATGSNS